MLNREMIEQTEAFLKRKFDATVYLNAHPDAKAYRLEHSFRVANIARQIAQREGFDETELVLAGLLHDVSYCEEFGEDGWIGHGRRAARIARPFLTELGLKKDRVDEICFGIAIHVDDEADFPGARTPFALSVGDADNIDRFDVYRIHETLTGDGFLAMLLPQKLQYTEKRLSRLRLWKSRLSFYIAFFEKLAEQLRCSEGVPEEARITPDENGGLAKETRI